MQAISISSSQLETALIRLAPGLDKYCWIQGQLLSRDVSTDREFQRRFAGFYRVRRNGDWRAAFFGVLESAKTSPISFAEALRLLHAATGQVEASFASKLVATVNPELPVIDSVVVGNLGLKVAKANDANRMRKLVDLHEGLAAAYAAYLASEDGRRLVRTFKGQYPTREVSEFKMLDLVLRQIRG